MSIELITIRKNVLGNGIQTLLNVYPMAYVVVEDLHEDFWIYAPAAAKNREVQELVGLGTFARSRGRFASRVLTLPKTALKKNLPDKTSVRVYRRTT